MIGLYFCVAISALIGSSVAECGPRLAEDSSFRLPSTSYPEAYKIGLFLEIISDLQFLGQQEITVKIFQNTDRIVLNSKNLAVSKVILKEHNCDACDPIPVNIKDDPDNEQLIIETIDKHCLESTKAYSLSMSFTGYLRKDYAGLFNSSYYDDEKEGYLNFASTMLKPTGARSVFPCYDEPEFKSKISLTIAHLSVLSVISNQEIEKSETIGPGYSQTTFKTVENVAPASLWFTISDFKEHVVNKRQSIVGKASSIENAAYAADLLPEITGKLVDHFGMQPSLGPKLTYLTIAEYNSSIIDSSGLIIFR
jgi:aminopeptidase N